MSPGPSDGRPRWPHGVGGCIRLGGTQPDVGGASAVAPMKASRITVGAHRRDGHAGLVQDRSGRHAGDAARSRASTSESRPSEVMRATRVPSAARPWSTGSGPSPARGTRPPRALSRRPARLGGPRGRRAATTWRSETKRRLPSGRQAGCPTERRARTVDFPRSEPTRRTSRLTVRSRRRSILHRRHHHAPERSHGMSGWSQTTVARRWRRRIERGGRRRSRAPTARIALGERSASPRVPETPAHAPTAPDRSRHRAPRAPPPPIARRRWPPGRRAAQRSPSGGARSGVPAPRPVTRHEPHPLIRQVHVGEAPGRWPGTRQTAPPPYSCTRLRMLDAFGRHLDHRSVRPAVCQRTNTTRPPSAGRDSSQ